MYNALQAQLSAKSVKEGEEALNDPILHSRAIVPLNPSHPKRFLTVVLFCFIFLAMGILFIFLRQSSLKIVYNTRQLRKNGVFENQVNERIKIWNKNQKNKIQYSVMDLLNYKLLSEVMETFVPEAIIHYAEQPSAPYSMASREKAVFTQYNNVVGNLNLL